MLATLARLSLSLIVVLALMAVLARFLKTRQLGRGLGGVRQRDIPIRVLGRHGVGRTASVTLVQVGGRVLLLGVTESSVQVLRELSEEALQQNQPSPDNNQTGATAAPFTMGSLLQAARDRTTRRS